MKNLTTIFLIRHAETRKNWEQCFLGKTNPSLNKDGIVQAKKLQEKIKNIDADIVYISPTKRTTETYNISFYDQHIPFTFHEGLVELDFGLWEGKTESEVKKLYPNEFALWQQDALVHKPNNGESMQIALDRLANFYNEIVKNNHGNTVVIIGHGGSLNIFLCMLLGIKPKAIWQFPLNPASISKIEIDNNNNVLVTKLNDTCHLMEEN